MREERKRKRRALLLALISSGLLVLFFLALVSTPPVPPPKPTGYLLVEFGPGGRSANPPPPVPRPKPKPRAAPRPQVRTRGTLPKPKAPVARTQAKPPAAPAVRVKKPLPKAAEPAAPVAKPAKAPLEPPKAAPAPASAKPAAPASPAGPPLVPPPAAKRSGGELPPVALPAPSGRSRAAPPGAPALSPGSPAAPEPSVVSRPGAPAAPPVETPVAPPAPSPVRPGAPPAPPASVTGETPVLPTPQPPAPPPGANLVRPPGPTPPTPQPGPEVGAARGTGGRHYEVRLRAALLVSVDNANAAYPQTGFGFARRIYEFPVEGGVTRLVFETRGDERGRVGPVRSARLYLLDLADALQGFLVHVGGSPLAQKRIEDEGFVTFDGLYDKRHFQRSRDRRPPHNDYADLGAIRRELVRLGLDRVTVKTGAAYTPPAEDPPGRAVTVRYAPDYTSGFIYQEGGYRWIRNGQSTAVAVDAVVLVYVKARVRDRVGRLAIELNEGQGGVYLQGRYQPVRWKLAQGGFVLTGVRGDPIDLTPYRVWFLIAPPWAKVE